MRAAQLKKSGQEPPSLPRVVVPSEHKAQVAWLKELFPIGYKWDEVILASIFLPQAVGRHGEELATKELHVLRLKIAHTFLKSGDFGIRLDSGSDLEEIHRWLPLTRCLARAYLRMEFPQMFSLTPSIAPSAATSPQR